MRPVILACIAFLMAVLVGVSYWHELRLAALKIAHDHPAVAAWDIEDAIFVRAGSIEALHSPRPCLSAESEWYIDKQSGETLSGISIINRCGDWIDVTDARAMLPIVQSYGSILPAKAMVAPITHKHGMTDMQKNIFFLDKTGEDCKSDMYAQGNRCNKAPVPPDRALFIEMLLPAKDGFIVTTADGKQLSGKLTGR